MGFRDLSIEPQATSNEFKRLQTGRLGSPDIASELGLAMVEQGRSLQGFGRPGVRIDIG